jgi:hypothetical protein
MGQIDGSLQVSEDDASANSLVHLAQLWAKRYVEQLGSSESPQSTSIESADSSQGRRNTANKLANALKFSTASAWAKTEKLLSEQVIRHNINLALINPWEIAEDTHQIYEQMLQDYQNSLPVNRLTITIGSKIGRMRKKYTSQEPRILGFVSMQFHYSGQLLLEELSESEQQLVEPYLKVLDDHLYMPLQRAYEVAGNYSMVSPIIAAVEHLIAESTTIAWSVYGQVLDAYPQYQCLTGALSSQTVSVSTIRDIEMFLIYLCLCTLEKDIHALQEELFPLCVMLYPPLKVDWDLIRLMFKLIRRQVQRSLSPADIAVLLPNLDAMAMMFSPMVLGAAS